MRRERSASEGHRPKHTSGALDSPSRLGHVAIRKIALGTSSLSIKIPRGGYIAPQANQSKFATPEGEVVAIHPFATFVTERRGDRRRGAAWENTTARM